MMRKARGFVRSILTAALVVAAGWAMAGADAEETNAEEKANVEAKGSGESSAKASSRTGGPQDMGQKRTDTSPAQVGESGAAAVSGELTAEEKRQIADRVQKRWEALVKRDFATAYTYETPAYRKENSLERFGAQFGLRVRWHMATVKEVRYDRKDEATAVIALDFTFDLPTDETARTTSVIRERWVRVDNAWWHRDERQPLGGGNQSQPSQRK